MKKLLSVAVIVALITPALSASAISESFVQIDDIVLSQCGPQHISFSGTTNLESGQELMVELDGEDVHFSGNESLWVTELVEVSVGTHQLTASIVEFLDFDPVEAIGSSAIHEFFVSEDSMEFEVTACPTPTPTPTPTSTPSATPTATPAQNSTDNGSGSNDGGGGNSEQSHSTPKPPVKKGQVKGATIKKAIAGAIPNKLVPDVVARIFKSVFGRAIKPFESTYWKVRARTDKVTETLLKGTMEWYKLHGKTVGKVK